MTMNEGQDLQNWHDTVEFISVNRHTRFVRNWFTSFSEPGIVNEKKRKFLGWGVV